LTPNQRSRTFSEKRNTKQEIAENIRQNNGFRTLENNLKINKQKRNESTAENKENIFHCHKIMSTRKHHFWDQEISMGYTCGQD